MEEPAFSKVLTSSYLSGAALGLPAKLFGAVFPETRSVRLRNAAGQEWSGKVSVRDDEHRSSARIEIMSGWGVFAKANGMRAGDEVRVQYQPEDVLLVTVADPAATASGTTARAATPAASQRGAQHSSSDGLAALAAAAAAGQVAEQQHTGRGKRSQPGEDEAAEQQAQQQAQQEVLQQPEEQQQAVEARQRAPKRQKQRSDPVELAAVAAAAAAAARDASNAAAAAALEMTRSYLSGAALMLPTAIFADCFPKTTACVLRNADGEEWPGKVTWRIHGVCDNARVEVTAGWGKFVKANELRLADEVKVEFEPPNALLVTVVKRGSGPTAAECYRNKVQQDAERYHATKGSTGPRQQKQRKPQKQPQPQQRQQLGRHKGQKRKRQQQSSGEEGSEAAEAQQLQQRKGRRNRAVAEALAEEAAEQAAAEQAAAEALQPLVAAVGGPMLVDGEEPYIRHSQQPTQPLTQHQEQQQGQQGQGAGQQQAEAEDDPEWYDCEGDQDGGTPYSGQYALHSSSSEEEEEEAGQAAAAAAAGRVERADIEGEAAAAAASASESESGGSPVRRPAKQPRRQQGRLGALAAAAGGLELGSRSGSQEAAEGGEQTAWSVGQLVVARDKQGRHVAGTVQALLPAFDGSVLLDQLGATHSFQIVVPLKHVLAEVPHGLVGWRVQKEFDEGWFQGTVQEVWYNAADDEELYNVRYSDGDKDDFTLQQLLPLLMGRGTAGKRRGRPPKQQWQQQRQRGQDQGPAAAAAEEAEEEEEEEPRRRPVRQPKQQAEHAQHTQQATLTGGRQRRPASAAAAVTGDASSAGVWVPPEPSAEAMEAAQQQGGLYEASGAGHERGVYAWDSKAGTMRPVGPWLVHKDSRIGTVLGRVARSDKRYLPDRQAPEGYRSPHVPGWIGVRTTGDNWTPDYDGQYCIALYDSHAATSYLVACSGARLETVEEAAKLYDRIALCYHGQTADTNYPTTQALWQELGPQEEFPGAKNCISLAARLAGMEQSVPYEAVDDSVEQAEWDDWEEDLVANYLCKRPTLGTAAGLAAKLKWLLGTLHEEAVFPGYRGAPLQRLLAACDACSGAGTVKDHYAPHSSSCYVCAANRKGADQRNVYHHGSTNLAALMKETETAVISQEALKSFESSPSKAAADAAATEEQEELDHKLAAWAGGCPASPGGASSRPAARRPRGGAATQPAAAAVGVRALRAAARYRHIPVQPGLKVIVIGGGVAGLKAAGDLQRGGAEVTVLEARDRLGGRIHTHTLRAGDVERNVDLGATFVCGTDRTPPVNPIFQYAVDVLGLRLQPKHRDGPGATALYDRDGSRIPDDALVAAEEKYHELIDQLHERTEPGSKAPRNETIQEAVDDILSGMELSDQERDIIRAFTVDLYVAELHQLSLRGMTSQGFAGKHELVVGGFKQVVEALRAGHVAPDLPAEALRDVRTGSVVTAVRLLPGGVGVEVDVEGEAEPLWAHAVVCTLPLGVLQRSSVAFDPPLPAYKQTAINGLGMGTENRVAMLFSEVFWPTEQHFLRPVTGHYTFANMHALGVPNVLSAWVRPEAVDTLEAMSDEEILADVLASLKQICPDGFHAPLDHTITRWKQDPFSFGAYSYVPPGGKKAYYDWLGHPVSGVPELDGKQEAAEGRVVELQTRLWFAGEATSKEDAYTVHGAYKTGEVQAVRIKKWWKAHHEQIERLRSEQQQRQQQQQQADGAAGGDAAAGGGRQRTAATAAKRRLASSVADS